MHKILNKTIGQTWVEKSQTTYNLGRREYNKMPLIQIITLYAISKFAEFMLGLHFITICINCRHWGENLDETDLLIEKYSTQ